MEQSQELIREIQKGLLQWYDFEVGSQVFYIGEEQDPLAEMLTDKALNVVYGSCDLAKEQNWKNQYIDCFDYIVCIEQLELQEEPIEVLKAFRQLIKKDGKLLLGMNNRFGVHFFCGDRDPYTNRCFDGVEGYKKVYAEKEDRFQGRCYHRAELKAMLRESEWEKTRFYSVFPELKNPTLFYAEDTLPNEDLANRLIPSYYHPQTVFLDERMLYEDLVSNGIFHQMANGYLIECTVTGVLSDIGHITCSMDRGREKALFTIIRKSGIVEKRAVYREGQKRLAILVSNGCDLAAHGISVVDARMEDGVYVMPYIQGEVAQLYLKKLLHRDKEQFLKAMDHFRELILRSSEIVREDTGDGEGAVLRRGYLELVPLNCFWVDGEFVFYDQEFYVENYPANAIITRMINTFYSGNLELNRILPKEELFSRYHLTDQIQRWQNMEYAFLFDLLNLESLSRYYEDRRFNGKTANSNRLRMNCSDAEYRKLFVDIFKKADTRKLILFGSGNFAQKFLALYGEDYPVYAVVDNNREKWGQEIEGVEIQSPEILKQLSKDEYKVLICIKNYVSVMSQLDQMGVTEYSVFDANIGYVKERRVTELTKETEKKSAPKKYHVGYISGVFDLFHIGHLNMFKRAKEQCDYLIVGVVTDEGVRTFKKVEPFVPFEERIELVRSCRYVDEAVAIPLKYNDTKEAYKLYRFDCQFSGSDYANDPFWIANQEFLEENGSAMVFFPYTESTSSSKIKELIQKKLL